MLDLVLIQKNMNDNVINICIPKMIANISPYYIKSVIQKSNIGKITKYKELLWKNDSNMKRIIMTILLNTNHENCAVWKSLLQQGEYLNIVHKFPDRWSLCLAKN